MTARMNWVIRSDHEPSVVGPTARENVHALDAGVAASSIRSLGDTWRDSLAGRRTASWLLDVFGLVALTLAMSGAYAVASFSVLARKRELAIRSMLGAPAGALISTACRGELMIVLLGAAFGLAGARLVSPWAVDRIFGPSGPHPLVYLTVALVLAFAGAVATVVPARRAAAADPLVLIRS